MPDSMNFCPAPIEFQVKSCQDAADVNLGEVQPALTGRIVQITGTLVAVCPNKRIAVAVQLTELDAQGAEHDRGVQMFTLPAHTQEGCQNIPLPCVQFVLPEDLNVSGTGLCGERNFRARVTANYVDSDYICCGTVIL